MIKRRNFFSKLGLVGLLPVLGKFNCFGFNLTNNRIKISEYHLWFRCGFGKPSNTGHNPWMFSVKIPYRDANHYKLLGKIVEFYHPSLDLDGFVNETELVGKSTIIRGNIKKVNIKQFALPHQT